MPTAVVILPSSTYRATDFVQAAESLGIDLVVASENPPPIDMGDRYLQIDCSDPRSAAEEIAELGERVGLDGVVAADDQGVMVAAHAAAILGLAANSPDAAAATRNKLSMRRRFHIAEVDQPGFAALEPGESPEAVVAGIGCPVVIKPLDRSASQGVIRVDDAADAGRVAKRIRKIVGADATLLVESYVSGYEIAVEGMVSGGDLSILAIFDKPATSDGPYFPETIFVTPSRLDTEILELAVRRAADAVRALDLTHGPAHIELRIQRDRAQVIEVAARSIGGLCSRTLNFGLMGTTLESLILRNAIGIDISRLHRESIASGVLMIPTPGTGVVRRIVGEAEVRAIGAITGIDLTIVPGAAVVAPPEGDKYVGFVYARSDTPESVETALRKAMSKLEVQLEG